MRDGAEVQVLVRWGTSVADVRRLLKKIRRMVRGPAIRAIEWDFLEAKSSRPSLNRTIRQGPNRARPHRSVPVNDLSPSNAR